MKSGCKIGNGIGVVGKVRVMHSELGIWGVAAVGLVQSLRA